MSPRFQIEVAEQVDTAEMFNALDLRIDHEHYSLTIAEARELSMSLAFAADRAELKLPE